MNQPVEPSAAQRAPELAPTTDLHPVLTHCAWRLGLSRRGRTGPGFPAGHEVLGHKCPLCPHPIEAGEPWQILVVGPDSDHARAAHYGGGEYQAAASVAHQLCMSNVSDVFLHNVAVALLAGGATRA